ncbi:hypothetical protein [Streptomyces sp. URMC 125]|uniref:hypothetical protein n=1 Tax=Streptomyces sp. URMC 125 TaxID=3423419 RepID=UPI003F1DF647
MTSASTTPHGMDEHPEVAEISDLTEGLLPPERSADVRAHLSGCRLCAEVRTSLEEIRSTLGTLPGPVRMPSDIAGRIDAALAAEALLDTSAPDRGPFPDTPAGTAGPGGGAHRSDAAVGGRTAVSRETPRHNRPGRSDRPTGRGGEATGPGRSPRKRAGRLRGVLIGAAGTAAALALGMLLLPGPEGNDGSQSAAKRSVEDRSDIALEERVRSLLAGREAGEPEREEAPGRGPAESGASEFSTKASPGTQGAGGLAVPGCVRKGIGREEAPLAFGLESYRGRQAYIVVLPHRSDSSLVDAYAVDAGCVEKAPSAPGSVIGSGSYER